MRNVRNHPTGQSGFTIVELMIATLVFSVILMVITAGVLHFTTSYYRGVNSSTTQTVTAGIVNAVTQTIQFSSAAGAAPSPQQIGTSGVWYICVATREFVYTPGVQDDGSSVGFYMFDNGGTCLNTMGDIMGYTTGWNARQDLLQPHMRLVDLSVSGTSGIYTVSATVAYGDSDLLCSPSHNGRDYGCNTGDRSWDADSSTLGYTDIHCKSQTGSQFCDVASLSTLVQQRVQ